MDCATTVPVPVLAPEATTRICNLKTEVYSRVCGYHRPVSNWNHGKKSEFKDRRTFEPVKSIREADRRLASERVA